MPFVVIPAKQVAAKPKKTTSGQRGRPLGTSPKQTAAQKKNLSANRSTVTVAAFGARLFEPIMAREKPIYVHFTSYIIRDSDSITRFSEDGFFAIKAFLNKINGKSRCYLAYFINPISPTPEHNLMQACQEAIDYKIFEFEDDSDYVLASQRKDKEGLAPEDSVKLRLLSALGRAEQKIIEILRERIIADKFLLKQREFEKQDEDWKRELEKQMKEEEEEETEKENDNVESSSSDDNNGKCGEESEADSADKGDEEEEEILQEAREEVSSDTAKVEEIQQRDEPKAEASSTPKPFVWGGGKK